MTPPNSLFEQSKDLQVRLAIGSQGDLLLPDQAALFEISLHNAAAQPIEAVDLVLNNTTPEFSLFDSQSNLLESLTPATRAKRRGGHVKFTEGPLQTRVLQPGQEIKDQIHLWKYTDPLPAGRYSLSAVHGTTSKLSAPAVPFEILAADVSQAAHGYNAAGAAAILAWISTPRGGKGSPKLLVRLGTPGEHELVAVGALSFGPATPRDKVSVSGLPLGPRDEADGWVALVSGRAVQLIHEDLAVPGWRSTPINLDADDLRPVPRFPNRGHALFLATGAGTSAKPVLLGVRVEAGKTGPQPANAPPPTPWTVPLQQLPLRAECVFGSDGPIRLLLVSQRGDELIFSRLDTSETGAVQSPERIAGRSVHRLLATAVDQRNPSQPAFLALLADPEHGDRLSLAHIPLEGQMVAPEPEPIRGWPMVKVPNEPGGTKEVARKAGEVFLEVSSDGVPWLAFTDDQGAFYGGPMRGPGVALLRDAAEGRRNLAPRVVVATGSTELCCFTETGRLFHAGGHGGH
jgi:hypothetical protein